MSYIGKNIKRIRAVKKLSQASFAELFALARPSVGAYEEGRSEPKIETIIAIAQYFGLSTDALLRKELSVNELYSLDIFKGEFDPTQLPPALGKSSKNEHNGAPPVQAPARAHMAGIPLISKSLRLEYIVNLQNRDFISRLQIVALPEATPGKTRAFEHSGGEMLTDGGGLREGDILTATAVSLEKAAKLQEGQLYVLVTSRELLTRRFKKAEGKEWYFEADNPAVPLLPLASEEILELWEVKGCWTTQLQPPSLLDHKLLLLEEEIRQLKGRVEGLEQK
jgi:transcriptional regulator with XRE-family HTH domain